MLFHRHILHCCIILITIITSNSAIASNEPQAFLNSIINTAVHQPTLISRPLITIQGQHTRMVTFTTYNGYKTTDDKLSATIWTNAEPELKQLCTEYVAKHKPSHEQLTSWIAQLLGLPLKQADTRRFVALDVPVIQAYYGSSMQNIGIFRPCTDPRIGPHSDGSMICPLQMNPNDSQITSDYKTWFINNSINSYTLKEGGAPWTERGYTYNWNPDADNVYGVSEFVILKNTPISIIPNPYDTSSAYLSAEEYCR